MLYKVVPRPHVHFHTMVDPVHSTHLSEVANTICPPFGSITPFIGQPTDSIKTNRLTLSHLQHRACNELAW